MAAKTDFTEQEWDALQKGVTGAGMLVSLADPSFFDSFKEIGAMTKHLAAARGDSTNPLIGEVAQVHGTGFGLTASPQEIETQTIEALKSSMSTLNAKSPGDAQAYRDFVLGVAKSVGEAAKGTSDTESDAIQKIEGALAGA
ncbi:hypothetical protein [Micromonospora sp. WMMD736]|uniref:hypothetical protein n=1 Tax=Micromonospora sp. WMMD736 TaxID=3404112 RepID=UPI003B936319